jgi:hypothetical protein
MPDDLTETDVSKITMRGNPLLDEAFPEWADSYEETHTGRQSSHSPRYRAD